MFFGDVCFQKGDRMANAYESSKSRILTHCRTQLRANTTDIKAVIMISDINAKNSLLPFAGLVVDAMSTTSPVQKPARLCRDNDKR